MFNNTISMEHDKNLIMVTWDFTEKSMYALEHAVQMSSILQGEISVVHIVKKESEIRDAQKRMAEEVKRKFTDPSLKFNFVVRTGNIFHTIGEIATETNALLVIMGTHGIVGMQKFLGSWALKVIASCKAPFIVVQDSPRGEALEKHCSSGEFQKGNQGMCCLDTFFLKKIRYPLSPVQGKIYGQ